MMESLKILLYRVLPFWAFGRYWRKRHKYSEELLPHFARGSGLTKIWRLRYGGEIRGFYVRWNGGDGLWDGHGGACRDAAVWKGVYENKTPPSRIVEVGSWKGASAVAFAGLFPNAEITCIDTFKGGDRLKESDNPEKSFDANTRHIRARIRKIKDSSASALSKLAENGETFDLVYIDADHHYNSVKSDTVLGWKLLKVGGVMIWDDYTWEYPPYGKLTPKPAVDEFLRDHRGKYRVLHVTKQVLVEKTAAD